MKSLHFSEYLKETLDKYAGVMVPVKAWLPERLLMKRAYIGWLRLGKPELIRTLQKMDYEVWVYTSSFRSEGYIRGLFHCYGVRFDGIVNGNRHMREVQKGHSTTLPQKLPSRYRISLHIDDEAIVCTMGRQYGYNVYQLEAEDDQWKEKIIERAEEIRRRESI